VAPLQFGVPAFAGVDIASASAVAGVPDIASTSAVAGIPSSALVAGVPASALMAATQTNKQSEHY
jgi:hypothetical protein